MMNKKTILIPFLIVMIAIVGYLFYEGKPQAFPDNSYAIKAMNQLYAEANVSGILDVIPLDSKHVFVPFISDDGHYGMSFWEWDWFQWKLRRIDTRGEPYIWKIDEKDASTHYIVWNMDPKDELSELKYYLIGERGAYRSQDVDSYTPRVQLGLTVSLQKHKYGVLPFPKDWVELINGNLQMNSLSSSMYIGWIPYGDQGKVTFPDYTINGSSYSSGRFNLDFVRILNEYELEFTGNIMDTNEVINIHEKVDIGGYGLVVKMNGIKSDEPVIVFESGFGGTSDTWEKLQSELSKRTLTVSYERAGLGRSSSSPLSRTSENKAIELHKLLQACQIEGPFIIVAHSLGGFTARMYATKYPEEVKGIVFVDSSYEQQLIDHPEPQFEEGSIEEVRSSIGPDGSYDEMLLSAEQVMESKKKDALRNIPINVLVGMKDKADGSSAWLEYQQEIAKLSDRSHLLTIDAGHGIHMEKPDIVIQEIINMMEEKY
ncbi:alpha/beta fold hydrolase [Paenibacillus sp. FA6]|uniref:alpha/beta fold hydrolase n=1 Tax=Paenibacillus sp. FA6 TaxID=3413029 RepID=UPI003F657422